MTYFGTTNINANADADGDGVSNYQEYLAGTSPVNGSEYLRITEQNFASGGTNATLTWTSVLTRFYHIQETLSLGVPSWSESGLGLISPGGLLTTRNFTDTNSPMRFYRVRAMRPLAP